MIEVSHVTKKYGSQVAVNDLSFTIETGQIYGLLGPNGAGKSTTMNIMTGCLAATSGDVKIDGYDIFEDATQAKKLIGYLPEQPPLYMDRTPREYLNFVGRAKGVREKDLADQVDQVMKVTQITAMQDRLIRNLSKGYKQRVGIAQAILGNPEVIILDEPTVGLDPHQILEIRELIVDLGKDHTIILSSHILQEVQAVCQTIMIISKGKLIACDTPENLERLMSGTTTINLSAGCGEEQARALLEQTGDFTEITALSGGSEGRCSFRLTSEQSESDPICSKLFFAFAGENVPILEMAVARASLEQVFLELTNASDEDAEPDEEDLEGEEEDEVEIEVEVEEGGETGDEEYTTEEQGLHYDAESPLLEDLEIDPETLEIHSDDEKGGNEQ